MTCNLEQDFWNDFAKGDLALILDDSKVQKLFSSNINGKTAAKILKHLTKAIVETGDTDCKYEHNILITSRFLLECIQSQPSDIDVSVLSCIYYISKQFIRKRNVDMALALKSYVMNYKGEFTPEIKKVYYGIFYELHTLLEQNHALYVIDMKLKIRYESLELLSCCGVNYLHVILSESNNFVSGEAVHANRICHLQYAIRVLKLIKNISENCIVKENAETVSKLYAQFLSNLMVTVLSDTNGIEWKKLFDVFDIIQTSNETCNKLIYFLVKMLKGMLDITLPVMLIREQTSTLRDMIDYKPNSLLFGFSIQFVRVFFSIQGHWLGTLTVPLSCEELLVVSDLAILLSSFLKNNIVSEHSSVEPSVSVLASFKTIINLLSLGVNFILSEVKDSSVEDTDVNVHNIFKMLLTVQTSSFDLLVLLRDNNETLWMNPWIVLASRSVKLASVLGNKGYYEHAYKVYVKFCCCFLEVEPVFEGKMEYIYTEVSMQKVFKGLAQCLMYLRKHKEALVNIGIAVLLLPDCTRELQKLWVMIKQKAFLENNLNLQEYTMCNVFQESRECIEATFTDHSWNILKKLNSLTYCRLLMWEAESYLQHRCEFSESMCAVGMSLMKKCCNTLVFGEGIELVLSGIWTEYDVLKVKFIAMYKRAVDVLTKLSMNGSEGDKWLVFSSLGNIHYYYFFAKVTALRKKLQEDITNFKDKFPSKAEVGVMKGTVDPSEVAIKSNLITAYADLDVNKEHELLNILQKAFDTWSSVCVTDKKIIQSSTDRFDRLLQNIKTTACTFALYGYCTISLKVWMLYYQLCKSSKYNTHVLYALSQLLEFSCYASDNALWKEAIGIGNFLQGKDMTGKEKEILLNFLLAKSNSCLINDQYNLGWQYLQKLNILSIPGNFTGQLACVRKHILLSKYYLCSSNLSVVPEDFKEGNAFLSVSEALRILKQLYHSSTTDGLFENCSLNLLMLEAAEWMGNLWLGLKMYKDGYGHLKKYLLLAQTLGLASRCSQIVSKLAQFDILLHEVDNTEVKLLGMETILCLRNMSPSLNAMEVAFPEETPNKIIGNVSLNDDIVRMKLLDVPTPARHNHMSSPELRSSPFKMPPVMSHEENCTCLFCNSLLLQNVVMETICIKAQLNILKGRNDIAMSFFKGGLKMGKKIKMLQEKVLSELSKTVHGNDGFSLYVSLSDPFHINFSKLFMDYTEFLYLSSCHKRSLLQEMMASSHSMLLNSQEYNLLIGLEMIDKAQLLCSENTKLTATAPETFKRNLGEEFNEQECSESHYQEIMKTPTNSKKKAIDAPPVYRNEDRMYLSKMSPVSVVNLGEQTPLVKTRKDEGKSGAIGRRKLVPSAYNDTIVLDDDNDDDSITEDDLARKARETAVDSHFACKNGGNLNPCLTSDDSNNMKELHFYSKDIELVTSGMKEIKISPENGLISHTFPSDVKSHIASKTCSNRQQREETACSSTHRMKSTLPSVLLNKCNVEHQTEACGNDIDYSSSDENAKIGRYFKSSLRANEYDSPFMFRNCHKQNEQSGQDKFTVLPVQRKYFQRKPKVIIYTDSPESNVTSVNDVMKENDKQTLEKKFKEYKAPETDKTLPSARKLRKPRNVCVEEKTAALDCFVPGGRYKQKKERNEISSNVPVLITLDTSDTENSVDVKCNDEQLDRIECPVSSHVKDNESQSHGSPERKATRARRIPISLDDTDLMATPVCVQPARKAVCQTSARKIATRSRRKNPFILD